MYEGTSDHKIKRAQDRPKRQETKETTEGTGDKQRQETTGRTESFFFFVFRVVPNSAFFFCAGDDDGATARLGGFVS